MMKNKLLISLILFPLIIFSCKEKEQKVDYAVISGKIENSAGGEMLLRNSYNLDIDTLHLKEDGSFVDTIKVEPIHYFLSQGRSFQLIYIEPGFELNVSFDAEHFDSTLAFSGTGAEINNYLLEKTKKQKEFQEEGRSVYDLSEEDYILKVQEKRAALEKILGNYDVPQDFEQREERNIHYTYLNDLRTYKNFQLRKDSVYEPSEDFLAEIKEIKDVDYDNVKDYLFSKDYRGLVRAHFSEKAEVLVKNDSIPEEIAFLKVVGDIKNDIIRNSLLYVNAYVHFLSTKYLDSYYTTFMAASTNEKHREKITKSYKQLKKLAPGSPSPQFVNYENYEGGVTSLADLKGKYVYIDVWATWCVPCVAEIPALKEIEKKYQDKNIAFVSISVDFKDDKEKWKKMIEEKELGGIQLFADNAFESRFYNAYKINGIPRFILIDPDGNIVDPNAPRPSNPKLIELFDSLNI